MSNINSNNVGKRNFLTRYILQYWSRADYILILITGLYAIGGYSLARMYDVTDRFVPLYYSDAVGLVSFFLGLTFLTGWTVYLVFWVRPHRLFALMKNQFMSFMCKKGRLAKALPIFASFTVLLSTFTSLKSLIPVVHEFSWDVYFAQLDYKMHGGHDAWTLLHPILGFPFITIAMNFIYNMWFFIMFAVLYWQLFSVSRPDLRIQFFFTFFLVWIINGTILAMIFSSAGPCFYEFITNDARYTDLIDYLHSVSAVKPLWALSAQEMLWENYMQSGIGAGTGISAMPSLHVAIAFLFALLGFHIHRILGIVFALYTLIIFLGSVHLGWHYAIDGYLSLFVTLSLWFAVGKIIRIRRAGNLKSSA